MSREPSDEERRERTLPTPGDGAGMSREPSRADGHAPPPRAPRPAPLGVRSPSSDGAKVPPRAPRPAPPGPQGANPDGDRIPPPPQRRQEPPANNRSILPVIIVAVLVLIAVGYMYFSEADRVVALENQVNNLSRRVDAVGEATELPKRVAQLETRMAQLDDRLEAIGGVGASVQGVKQAVADLSTQLGALSKQISAVEASVQAPLTAAPSPQASPSAAQSPAETAEPEAQPSSGAADRTWEINLISVTDLKAANQIRQRLADIGVQARIDTVPHEGKSLHRVVVPGFASYTDAQGAATRIKRALNLTEDPWIARR